MDIFPQITHRKLTRKILRYYINYRKYPLKAAHKNVNQNKRRIRNGGVATHKANLSTIFFICKEILKINEKNVNLPIGKLIMKHDRYVIKEVYIITKHEDA